MDKNSNLPFFARFLETQELEQVNGGGTMHTMKYPSDSDEHGGGMHTMKFPSDSDELGGGTVHTMKYPSDSDEAAI
jgi:hypothetical protein